MNDKVKGKAIALAKLIKKSNKIFIVGHKEPDFDSIASSIGLQILCEKLGTESYIVLDKPEIGLEPGVKKIKEQEEKNHNIISVDEFEKLVDDNSLLIMTDVNKKTLIPVSDHIDKFKDIVIFDHHDEDEYTPETEYKYINTKISSACEIITQLLTLFKVNYDKMTANYLLAGIVLDTKRYKKNTTLHTHEVAEKLMRHGAETEYVNSLFLEEFDTDKRINNLVYNGTYFKQLKNKILENKNISFTLNRQLPNTIYKKEDLAKAADKMLKYPIDAAFVIGFVKDNTISVSARSKSNIDVGKVLERLNGGGNPQCAGARITTENIDEIERLIELILTDLLKENVDDTKIYKKVK